MKFDDIYLYLKSIFKKNGFTKVFPFWRCIMNLPIKESDILFCTGNDRFPLNGLSRYAFFFCLINKAVARGGGGATGACAPPFKKTLNYFLCRIIHFYTNNPKCQYVYLSFYLNDYQIIEEWNWKISYFRQEVTFNLEKVSTFSKKKNTTWINKILILISW